MRVVLRGSGEVGSAVAHRLFRAGIAVVLIDGPQPTTTRRQMAFTDAIFDGAALLDGIRAVRMATCEDVRAALDRREVVPVVVDDLAVVLACVEPTVLVDARMRKRAIPEPQRGLAPLAIGLGPNFIAGETVDVAIETSWDAPGAIIERGPTRALAGEPRPIEGHARDRYVYAPCAGMFTSRVAIGDAVGAGDIVAHIDEVPLVAPLTGVVRGITRSGVPVPVGTKVFEVDPRGPQAVVSGIGDRPGRIANGVVAAIEGWEASNP